MELLIVCTIIVIIAGIGLRVGFTVVETSKVSATKATVERVTAVVNDRLHAITLQYPERDHTKLMNTAAYKKAQQYSTLRETQLVLARKLLQMEALPQTFAEAAQFGRDIKAGMTNPTLHKTETESAECLYAMLSDSGNWSTLDTADTDGDGLLEFVDGWGKPLRFYRWPTRFYRPAGESGNIDKTAADMLFDISLPVSDLMRDQADYQNLCKSVTNFENLFHTPSTFTFPIVVSVGPDGIGGLREPTDIGPGFGSLGALNNLAALDDDISTARP